MSVTLHNVLQLTSFKNAKVLAGKPSLEKIVTSVTVLEYANMTDEHNLIFDSIAFIGGELVITSFASSKDDIKAQLANVRALAKAGEVGLVVYYVGIILPEIDKQLIRLCDELDFALICMPENDPTLQYSSVITETMDLIIKDQMNSSTLALDILEQISKLPKSQQTIDTLLALISNRIRASVAILNANGSILSAAAWPRLNEFEWNEVLEAIFSRGKKPGKSEFLSDNSWYYYEDLQLQINRTIRLVIYSENNVLNTSDCQQSAEGIRLGLNLWGDNHEKIGKEELLKSIIQDEPIRMRRLAALYHVDIAAINEAWIIHSINNERMLDKTSAVKSLSDSFMKVCICEAYEGEIILMPAGFTSLAAVSEWIEVMKQYFDSEDIKVSISRCSSLQNTSDVKEAYWNHKKYLLDTLRVFPHRSYLNLQEILFVKRCREIANQGEQNLTKYLFLTEQLTRGNEEKEMIDTLQVFFLDTHFSVTETAKILYVHKNTIKYRLGKVSNILGFRIGEMPSSEMVMEAMGLLRLLE